MVNWTLYGRKVEAWSKSGRTAGEIAALIPGATRSAVIGWLNRKGLSSRRLARRHEVVARPAVAVPVVAPDVVVPSVSGPRPLVDLARGACRFAVDTDDDGRHLFCAAATGDDAAPFCAYHAAIVYTPWARRTRKVAA